MSVFIKQTPLVLRLPEDLADTVRQHLESGEFILKTDVQQENPNRNYYRVIVQSSHKLILPAMLVNLPTRLETHKLFESFKLFKSTDIGQMLHVFKTPQVCTIRMYYTISIITLVLL